MTLDVQAVRSVSKQFGPRQTDMKYGGRVDEDSLFHTAVWDFNYDSLPAAGTNNQQHVIPANSVIVEAYLRIITAFTSTSTTTDLTVGLEQADGTDIDLDGLITAAQATQTTIAVAPSLIKGSSGTPAALINVGIGSAAGELIVTPSAADLTAGRAQVIVTYLIPAAAPAA